MIGKRIIMAATIAVLIIAATSELALARGFGGRGEGAGMWLLARAAGLNHTQVATAFQNDQILKTQRDNVKATHDAMMECVLAGKDCTSQISSFANAQQAFTQERMTVWQNLFRNAPNSAQAAKVYSQLQQLQSQKRQIIQKIVGSNDNNSGTAPAATPSDG